MMRFTRKRGSCVVGSLVAEVFLAFPGGGVLLMVGEAQRSGGEIAASAGNISTTYGKYDISDSLVRQTVNNVKQSVYCK